MLGWTKSREWIMIFSKKFPCTHCDKEFRKHEQLMNLLQITHYKDLPYDCKVCNQNFSNMEDMRTHLQRFHSYKKDRD